MRLIHLGILDEREGFDMLMTAATRAMRHMSATVMRLWAMYENERQRVCVLQAWAIKLCLKNAFRATVSNRRRARIGSISSSLSPTIRCW